MNISLQLKTTRQSLTVTAHLLDDFFDPKMPSNPPFIHHPAQLIPRAEDCGVILKYHRLWSNPKISQKHR